MAQLLYDIGKHRVSVFVVERSGDPSPTKLLAERTGFHLLSFRQNGLEVVAISDVDPAPSLP